jgi:hypothetical protein
MTTVQWKLNADRRVLTLDASIATWLRDGALREEVAADARLLSRAFGGPIDIEDNEGRPLACIGAVTQ